MLVVAVLVGCGRQVTQLDKLRGQVEEVTARARAVMAGAHTAGELRAARHALVDLQLELADLSDRIDRVALQSRR